jgi:hypothetical protein
MAALPPMMTTPRPALAELALGAAGKRLRTL